MEAGETPTLDTIIGQPQAVGALRSTIASGRVHHAWIFSGPAGVGKRTTAMAFAATILDGTTAPDLTGALRPDPGSHVQQMIRAGTHPDLHVITKELALHSDDARVRSHKLTTIPKDVITTHLLEPITRAASVRSEGSLASKVFIVDEAELLRSNLAVQNAILKTLEEPPPGSVIILITSAEEALLPTIRSRCQRVVFRALEDADMEGWFRHSGIDAKGAERDWLLWYAAGAPGRALEAAQTGLYAWMEAMGKPLKETESGRYQPALGGVMAGLIDEWAKAWVESHENASKEAANMAATRHMLWILAERARERLRASEGDPAGMEHAAAAIDAVLEAEGRIAAHVPVAPVLETMAVKIARAGALQP